MRKTPTWALLAVGPLLIGCDAGNGAGGSDFVVRDSAGVTVVENGAPEWTEETAWRLSAAPTLSIGLLDGPLEYLFSGARAIRLDDGRILVGDAGTSELRLYDADGTHLWTTGRAGDGPGEFRRIQSLWRLGSDSVVVRDGATRLLHVFDLDGALGRTFRLSEMEGARAPTPLGILSDRSMLVDAGLISEDDGLRLGRYRDERVYAAYSVEGAHARTFMQRPGSESWAQSVGRGTVIGALPNGLRPVAAAAEDSWYFGSGERWEVEQYSADGMPTRLIRRDEPRRTVPELPSRDCVPQSERIETSPTLQGISIDPPTPDSLPAYRGLLPTDDGSLWVQHYVMTCEQPTWSVFGDDGRYLGDVETPLRATIQQVGEDFVLLVQRDDLGVERVQLYDLIKPQGE